MPKTISAKAQGIVKSFSYEQQKKFVVPMASDIKGWRELRRKLEGFSVAPNRLVVTKFQPTIVSAEMAGVPVLDIKPQRWQDNGKVLIFIHGGAYTFGSAQSSLVSSVPVADETGLRVIDIDYSVAPVAKWEEILGQVITVIQDLYENGYKPHDIAFCGDSSGGGLAAAAVLKIRDLDMGMPAAVVLRSPWSDITETGDTYHTLRSSDPKLLYETVLKESAAAYANVEDQKNPYVSPVYGDFEKGFPPTLIQGGTKEIFLSNSVRLYQKIDMAGQTVKLDLYEGMWHGFHQYYEMDEAVAARGKMVIFLKQYLGY